MMVACGKCTKLCGLLLLVVGILFLLADLNVWEFWGIQWWTVIFLLTGLGYLCMSSCPACTTLREGKK